MARPRCPTRRSTTSPNARPARPTGRRPPRRSRLPRHRTTPKRASEPRAPSGADELWLAVQQEICGRAAHEIKGALNGVSVNLEVVRSRAGQGKPADAIQRYADAA